MSNQTSDTNTRDVALPAELADQDHSPATIGVVADGDPIVLENIIEAIERGCEVIVVDATDGPSSIVRVAEHLGASVFAPDDGEDLTEELRQYLRVRADADSAETVLIGTDGSRRIDFERTLQAGAATEGIVEPVPRAANDPVEVLVGIPAYNEAKTIGDVVRGASQYADHPSSVKRSNCQTARHSPLQSVSDVMPVD